MTKKNINYKELWENLKRYLTKRVKAEPNNLLKMNGLLAYEAILTVMDYSETVIISSNNALEKKNMRH